MLVSPLQYLRPTAGPGTSGQPWASYPMLALTDLVGSDTGRDGRTCDPRAAPTTRERVEWFVNGFKQKAEPRSLSSSRCRS